jgi:putative nucleotidyltransferase with HDIG domain
MFSKSMAPAQMISGSSGAIRPIIQLLSHPRAKQVLPSLEAVVKQLQQVASQKDVSVQDISRVIRYDQSLAVRIIRLANSAAFGPSEAIVDLDEAIIYLGLANVRTIVVTTRCIENTCGISSTVFPWSRFWAHSVAVGHIARNLGTLVRADVVDLPDGETLYVTGLLHDIGKLVLAHLSAEDFVSVLEEARRRGVPTAPVEAELLGLDHAGIGAWYLQQQGLPPQVFESVRRHHAWDLDGEISTGGCLINLADQIAHYMEMGQSGSHFPRLPQPYESPEWEMCVSKFFRPARDGNQHRSTLEKRLATLPALVQNVTAP